jgi:hypothetical protein
MSSTGTIVLWCGALRAAACWRLDGIKLQLTVVTVGNDRPSRGGSTGCSAATPQASTARGCGRQVSLSLHVLPCSPQTVSSGGHYTLSVCARFVQSTCHTHTHTHTVHPRHPRPTRKRKRDKGQRACAAPIVDTALLDRGDVPART